MDGYVDRQALQDIADAIREKNGSSDTYTPSEMAEAILDLSGNINLQDKQVTITENGTQTITANEGYDGPNSVEVVSSVYEGGFDLVGKYGATQEASLAVNGFLKESFTETSQILSEYSGKTDWSYAMRSVFWMDLDTSNVVRFIGTFQDNKNLIYISALNFQSATQLQDTFNNAVVPSIGHINATKCTNGVQFIRAAKILNIENNEIVIDCGMYSDNKSNCTFQNAFYGTTGDDECNFKILGDRLVNLRDMFANCKLQIGEFIFEDSGRVNDLAETFLNSFIKKIKLGSVENVGNFTSTFYTTALEEVKFSRWKRFDISLSRTEILSAYSIHYIIQNAMSVADGATARTLILHATAKTNWQNSEYYEQDSAVLTDKGIEIS